MTDVEKLRFQLDVALNSIISCKEMLEIMDSNKGCDQTKSIVFKVAKVTLVTDLQETIKSVKSLE